MKKLIDNQGNVLEVGDRFRYCWRNDGNWSDVREVIKYYDGVVKYWYTKKPNEFTSTRISSFSNFTVERVNHPTQCNFEFV